MKLSPEVPALLPDRPARRHAYAIKLTLSLSERPDDPDFDLLGAKLVKIIRKLEGVVPELAKHEWIIGNDLVNLQNCYSIDGDFEKSLNYMKKRTLEDFEFDGMVIIPSIQNGREHAAGVSIFGELGTKSIGDLPACNGTLFFGFGAPYLHDWGKGGERGALEFSQIKSIIQIFADEFKVVWASVADGDYTSRLDEQGNVFGSYQVFEHRYSGGWMVLVNGVLESSDVPEAADVVLLHGGKTLIVTTNEVFSSYNLEHVEKARAIEVRLNELGVLPALAEPIQD